jgi:hypothetical protein
MPKFTRKRGGAHSLPAHKSRTRSRKVLHGRNRPGSRAAATLASHGIGVGEYFPPSNSSNGKKPRKSRKVKTMNITEAPNRRISSRRLAVLQKAAAKTAAVANAEAKKEAAAKAKMEKKQAEAAEAAEELEMEALRINELSRKLKTHPIIAPSSLTHPIEHAKHVKNFGNTVTELGNMKRSRAKKTRASASRSTAPNLGKLTLGSKLPTINEN